MTAWTFVINCLAFIDKPIVIEDDFWQYTHIADRYIREAMPGIRIKNDHYALEQVLWYNDPLILKNDGCVSLKIPTLDFSNVNELLEHINKEFGEETYQKLVSALKRAYKDFKN